MSRSHHNIAAAILLLSILVFIIPCRLAHSKDDEAKTKAGAEAEAASRQQMHYYFKGRHLYQSQCVPCHGERGRGDGPWSEGLTFKPRNFRTGLFKFRTTPYGKLPTEDDLRRTIRNGISGTAMPTFQKLSDSDITGLIVYVQSFSRRWKDPEVIADPLPMPDAPDWLKDRDALTARVAKGATRFAEFCSACHGVGGKGDGPASKTLIDIWGNPIPPADLTAGHHKSGDAPGDLFRTITTGLDGTPMVGFHGTLSEQEIWELVAFIKSIEGSGAEKPKTESVTETATKPAP